MEERIDPRWDFVEEFLARQRERGLLRVLREVAGVDGRARIKVEGRWLLNLASNDYLGLKTDPRLREAAASAATRWGSGSGASRLVAGTTSLHLKLEEALARFHGSAAALTFSSGYAAGVGVIAALAGREDRVLLDRLCHASLYDGARLSGAALGRFRHNDPAHLTELLEREAPRGGRTLVVTDTVFSMEGDRAPLGEIARACRERGALLLVDEAHAVGVLGPGGRGLAAEAGLAGEDALVLGTLGKAFGAAGAYVACSARIRDYLVNACRALIYSTAPPPSLIGSLLAALEAVREAEEPRARLAAMANRLRERLRGLGLDTLASSTQIVPAVLGEEEKALEFAAALADQGVFAPAIRPPTVPDGASRVRFSLTAALAPGDFEAALTAIGRAWEQVRRA